MTEGFPPPPPPPGDPDPTRRWPDGGYVDPPTPPYTPPTTPPSEAFRDPDPTGPIVITPESGPDRDGPRLARLGRTLLEFASGVAKAPVAAVAGSLATKAAKLEGRAEELEERDPNVPTLAMRTQRTRAMGDVQRLSNKAQKKADRAATEAPAQFKARSGAIGGVRSARARAKAKRAARKISDPDEARAAYEAASGVAAAKAPGRGQRFGPRTASRADLNPNAPGIVNPFYTEGVTSADFDEPARPGEVPLRSSMPGVQKARSKAERAETRHGDLVETQQSRLEGSRRSGRIERRNRRRAGRRNAAAQILGGAAELAGEAAETLAGVEEESRERIKEIDNNRAARRKFKRSPEGKAAKEAKKAAKKADSEAKKAAKQTPPPTPPPNVDPGDDEWYDPPRNT